VKVSRNQCSSLPYSPLISGLNPKTRACYSAGFARQVAHLGSRAECVGEQYKRSVYCEERSEVTSPCLQSEAYTKRWRTKPTRILARRPNATTDQEVSTIAAHFSRAKAKINHRSRSLNYLFLFFPCVGQNQQTRRTIAHIEALKR
jgi:hypothetical protein